jgi:branched-chain amino acid transport system substrate-binding protein
MSERFPPEEVGEMRTLLRLGLAAIVMLWWPSCVAAQAPIKIGVVMPYTGVFTVVGQDTTKGLELYFAKVGFKAGGREVQLLKEDEEGKPDVGLTKTRKLVERDRVDALVGPVHAGLALAMRDYVHAQAIPLVVPVPGISALTAPPKASPWIVRVTETNDMSNYTLGTWVVRKTPYRKLAVMASDFAAGRQSAGAFVAAFKSAGGEIVKEIYPPLNTPDFAPFLAQLAGVDADAVYAWFAGADAIRFVKGFQEYGLAGKLPLLAYNSLVDDVLLPALGEAALGIVSVGHYSATLDTPENRSFVREYEARYNAWPTRYSEQGYVSAQLLGAAVETLKGETGDRGKLRDAILGAVTRIQPPRGPIQFDRHQQVITSIYVMRVERQGNRLVNAIVDRIPAVTQDDTWKWWYRP